MVNWCIERFEYVILLPGAVLFLLIAVLAAFIAGLAVLAYQIWLTLVAMVDISALRGKLTALKGLNMRGTRDGW